MSKSVFESKKWKKFMGMAYGVGAAIVIVGALFKIMHWKGADAMLILGMGTEAVIFLISAFEPVHEELDWTLVYPELAGMEGDDRGSKKGANSGSVSQQLDKMLADAKIGPELIEGLGSGLRSGFAVSIRASIHSPFSTRSANRRSWPIVRPISPWQRASGRPVSWVARATREGVAASMRVAMSRRKAAFCLPESAAKVGVA